MIPIPLHPKKERERGFNQSLLIAEALRDFLSGSPPLISQILVRVKNTKAQAEIKDSDKRKENVRSCFAVKNPSEIKGKNIILIDDVFTSGATANEAVRTLKTAGARRILVLVLAKA
jgi:ComF family protein